MSSNSNSNCAVFVQGLEPSDLDLKRNSWPGTDRTGRDARDVLAPVDACMDGMRGMGMDGWKKRVLGSGLCQLDLLCLCLSLRIRVSIVCSYMSTVLSRP